MKWCVLLEPKSRPSATQALNILKAFYSTYKDKNDEKAEEAEKAKKILEETRFDDVLKSESAR